VFESIEEKRLPSKEDGKSIPDGGMTRRAGSGIGQFETGW
jgi:hypothetical protein